MLSTPEGPTITGMKRAIFVLAIVLVSCMGREKDTMLRKAIVTKGWSMAGAVKSFVAGYYIETGRLPSSNEEARVDAQTTLNGQYVSSIAIGPQGVVTVTYTGEPALEGKTLVLTPSIPSNARTMTWSCNEGTVSAEYRPVQCK